MNNTGRPSREGSSGPVGSSTPRQPMTAKSDRNRVAREIMPECFPPPRGETAERDEAITGVTSRPRYGPSGATLAAAGQPPVRGHREDDCSGARAGFAGTREPFHGAA